METADPSKEKAPITGLSLTRPAGFEPATSRSGGDTASSRHRDLFPAKKAQRRVVPDVLISAEFGPIRRGLAPWTPSRCYSDLRRQATPSGQLLIGRVRREHGCAHLHGPPPGRFGGRSTRRVGDTRVEAFRTIRPGECRNSARIRSPASECSALFARDAPGPRCRSSASERAFVAGFRSIAL